MKLTIATWNIACGVTDYECGEKWNSTQYIIDQIKKNKIDVLLLQEVVINPSKNFVSLDTIVENGPLKHKCYYELSPSHLVSGATMGIAIISKYPLKNDGIFYLKDLPLKIVKNGVHYKAHRKAFMCCYIEELDIYIINGHCPSFGFFNCTEKDFLNEIFVPLEKKLIEKHKDKSIIIGADFNTTNLPYLMPKFNQVYSSQINEPTRPTGKQTDYIYTKELVCLNKNVIPTFFDHYCCVVEVQKRGDRK